MKDFPVFTTEYGVASLFLKEIPYRETAYIVIRDTLQPEELLKECVSFSRICGAEHIFATGHEILESYPFHCSILEMRGEVAVDESKVEHLFPVTAETVSQWRQVCNDRMRSVDNAATQEARDEKRILESGGAYFVHREGHLRGIGWMEDGELLEIAAVEPGAGERVMHTLLSAMPAGEVRLQVASTNHRAIRLYERMGLIRTAEISRWYRIV